MFDGSRLALAALATAALGAGAAAQSSPPPSTHLPWSKDSGFIANTTAQTQVVISFPIYVEGADWLRLEFEDVQLGGNVYAGNGAFLRLTSTFDGAVQELNAIHVEQWQRTSAYFNGDTVMVEVVAPPGAGQNRVLMKSVTASLPPGPGAPESQCGPTDDRVASSDPRAGRLLNIGCTAWLIDDCSGCFITAGHCTSSANVVQFNVPLSLPSGSIQHPPPSDQYMVDPASMQTNGGQGVGNDYAYFGTFPNATTGLTAKAAQGQTYVLNTTQPFNASEQIRITGYGVDGGTANQTQQTHAGPWVTGSGTTVQYKADTMGGNSGSPVIHEPTGTAIGVHSHGGCQTSGAGQNSGTRANHPGLAGYLANPMGICNGGGISTPPLAEYFSALGTNKVEINISTPIQAGSAMVHFRYQGGAFTSMAMTDLGGGNFSADLPAALCTDTPEYYFSIVSTTCGPLVSPGNAPVGFYSAGVGDPFLTFNDTFNTANSWTTQNLGATSGDFERAMPINDPGNAFDPLGDSDGSGWAFVTGNSTGNSDVDGGAVQLTSPVFDFTFGPVEIEFDYYLNLSSPGGSDNMLVQINENAGAGPWTTLASINSSGGTAWRTLLITQGELDAKGVTSTDRMRMRITVDDEGADHEVEAGIDAFRIRNILCGSLGSKFCTPGTLGVSMSASGTTSISAANLTLHATGVPTNKTGIFIYSIAQQQVPFGNGFLCVGGMGIPVARMKPAVNSGAGNSLDLQVNYANLPSNGPIVAGSTWNFQAWFRDGTGLFDLSDGVRLTFGP